MLCSRQIRDPDLGRLTPGPSQAAYAVKLSTAQGLSTSTISPVPRNAPKTNPSDSRRGEGDSESQGQPKARGQECEGPILGNSG